MQKHLLCAALLGWMSSIVQTSEGALGDAEYCLRQNGFYCPRSSKCIDARKRCDRVLDCLQKEDEYNCPTSLTTPAITLPTSIAKGCYRCSGSVTLCIMPHLQCDGLTDCPGGDDEANCRDYDDKPPPVPGPAWLWPVLSTVAGVVGGALLCTATALAVQRCRRRLRRARAQQEHNEECPETCEEEARRRRAFVGSGRSPPPYAAAVEVPFEAHNPIYFSTCDTPPKYIDLVPDDPPTELPHYETVTIDDRLSENDTAAPAAGVPGETAVTVALGHQ